MSSQKEPQPHKNQSFSGGGERKSPSQDSIDEMKNLIEEGQKAQQEADES